MRKTAVALAFTGLAIVGSVAGFALGRGDTSASPFEVTAKFQKGLAAVSWPQIDGVTGYALLYDGTQVATAGPSATSTRFSVGNGQHTLTVQPIWTPATTSTTTTVATTTATTTTTPTTTVTPPPSSFKPFGALRLGTDYSKGTGYDRYGLVVGTVSDADQVAALPASVHRLVYMSAIDSAPWFDGVSQTEALANGWTLLSEATSGEYLLDPGNSAYQQAFIREVGDFLRAHRLDGFYMDDVNVDPRSLTACGCWPAKYANGAGWVDAMTRFVQVTGDALKAQGFYVGANAVAFFPGNVGAWPGTDSNTGTSDQHWAQLLAPHLSFYMVENFQIPNGVRRTDQTAAWPGYWKGFLQVEDAALAAGADFWVTEAATSGTDTAILYGYGSQLLDYTPGRGGTMVNCACDPFNAVWARDPGAPVEAKTLVGSVWRRRFVNFTVYVNPTLTAQTADGHTLAAASAIFVP